MPVKKTKTASPPAEPPSTEESQSNDKKRWVKMTPRDHVLKQIEIQKKLVSGLRKQLEKEEQTLQGMEKAKEFFPAE